MQKIVEFLKGSQEELKKVKWPSRKDTIRLTAYVIGVSLGLGLFVSGFDYLFKEALATIIK